MNNLYETLEICLQELEQGADIETVLFRYPDLADELRPILETSVNARKMAVPVPSAEVVQRNRAKVLQHAAQLREAKANLSRRIWFAPLRRLAVTLVVLAVLFASGTGLVRAASNTLPGDQLYPVKRTWEDVLVAFTFDPQQRGALEVEYENERLHELQEVFAEGRSTEVDFAGSVTSQQGNEWIVSNVRVMISTQTEIRGGSITVGSAVRVKGQAQNNHVVSAERIEALPAGAKLPDMGDEPEIESEKNEGSNQLNEDNSNSGKGSGEESPTVEETKTAEPNFEPKDESLSGTVNSMDSNVWDVSGIPMDVSSAEIKGTPSVGASVKVEGYYDANGVFIVTKIEFESSGSGNDNSSISNDTNNNSDETNSSGSNDTSGSNSNDSNSNDSHDDSSHNSNDDSGGGGSNSGSGGSGGGGGD